MKQNLAQYFQTSLFMSGTPAEFQSVIAKDFSCDCPIYEAVKKEYVCRFLLNLIQCHSSQMNSAILAVYKREKNILLEENKGFCSALKFPSHIIVNCSSIDEINSLYNEVSKIPLMIEDNVHLISIHSKKEGKNKKLNEETLSSKIDGETDIKKFISEHEKEIKKWLKKFNENDRKIMTPKTVMDVLELINEGVIFKGEPVILFQVDMISEGINIGSFNASIIKSKAQIKTMQQIGRPIRNYTLKKNNICRTKIKDGHANLYAIIENQNEVADLLDRLGQYELTSDAFDWGRKIDLSNGSVAEPGDDVPTINDFVWEPITNVEIIEYQAIQNYKESRKIDENILFNLPAADMTLVAEVLNYNTNKIKNILKNSNVKTNINKKNKKKKNNKKKPTNKNKFSIQAVINNLRRTIIHNQLEVNQPHGWAEWTKYNDEFILRYVANGNEKYTNAIKNVLKILKPYLHLDTNPNTHK